MEKYSVKDSLDFDDEVDIRERSLYARLKKLFSSGTVVRNVGGKKLKVIDTDNLMLATDKNSGRGRFNRVRSTGYNAYTRDFALSYQAARIDLFRDYDTMDMDPILSCLSGDTYVSTLNGNYTMKQLCDLYSNGDSFEVWSWDNDKCQYTIGNAHHPRKTGKKKVIELVFDNGEVLKCTEDHRILLIDGTYKQSKDIKPGDSVMPFLYKNEEYMKIKSKGKYKKVHRFIYEDVFGKDIYNQAIHHVNHNKYDNRTCNLQEMSITEHALHHKKSKLTRERKRAHWTPELRHKKSIEVKNRFKDPSYKKQFSEKMKEVMSDEFLKDRISKTMKNVWNDGEYAKKALSGWRKWQDSTEGKKFMSTHSSKLNRERWKNDLGYREKMTQIFSNHAKELWKTPGFKEKFVRRRLENLRIKMANDPEYSKKKYGRSGKENGNFNKDITNEYLLVEGVKYNTLIEFAKSIDIPSCQTHGSKSQFITRRLNLCGYSSFSDYKNNYSYSNHKLVEIIDRGEETDVYDLTVDHFENFCLKSGIIVSNSALDIYSDESLVPNELGEILVVHTDDSNIKDILNNLFYDILNIQFNLWSWTRNMCKYGDFFLRLYVSPTYGVYFAEPICAYNVERIENSDPLNKSYVKFQIRPTDSSQAESLEEFEMVHFRLLSDSNFLPYGKGMIEGARRIWKQLSLMEDAMLIHRIMRAPEKRIFKIDIGNIPPNEVDAHIEKLISKMKKVPYLDQRTGDYNLRFNLQNMVEDFFLPVRGSDSGNSIENLSGMEWTGTDDIEYLRNKLMAALKIPKSFLGYDEDLSGKATLAAEDVRFARTVSRIQNFIISSLGHIARVHLYAQGYRDEELVNFSLELTNPSIILEKEKVEMWSSKLEVAKTAMENKIFSKSWIYEHLFDITEDDRVDLEKEIIEDAKQMYRYKSIEEDGNDPAMPFKQIKSGGDGGADAGGDEPGGMGEPPDIGGDMGSPGEPDVGGSPDSGESELAGALKEIHGEPADDYVRPSQKGEKDASDYPFGEDPLGDKENSEKPRKKSNLVHHWAGGSPFQLGSIDEKLKRTLKPGVIETLVDPIINSLDVFLSKTNKTILAESVEKNKESGSSNTFLDEKNILD